MNKKQILILKVLINENDVDFIRIHEDDEPEDLASDFVKKHSLSLKKKTLLEKIIEKQIDAIVERDFNEIRHNIPTYRSHTPTVSDSRPQTHRTSQSRGTVARPKSDLLIKQKLSEKILEIFNYLHPGRDLKISFGTIKLLDLQVPIFEMIRPVVNSILEKKQVLGIKEFTREIEKAVKGFSKIDLERFLSYSLKSSKQVYSKSRRHQILN